MNLAEEIRNIVSVIDSQNQEVVDRFINRTHDGALTRDENDKSHFCSYFLPYNPDTKQVFIVHHKKSGLWLAPGGHVDKDEDLLTGLNREIQEELGVDLAFSLLPKPFLLTITPINNPPQTCQEHLDFWFLLPTDGTNFAIDPQEFHTTRWVNYSEAYALVTDPANIQALQTIEHNNF
jgi:8-oxo-dGTP diphosphatase